MIFITVKSPAGRQIYVGRDYSYSYPTGEPIVLQAGTHTFETVLDGAVDYRGRVVNVANGTNMDLDLQPVMPPEPTAGGGSSI